MTDPKQNHTLTLPLSEKDRLQLQCGDVVSLSGTVYTARDAAHKRLTELLAAGKPLPLPLKDAAIYYCGPTPKLAGEVIGSCGPTTSARMDDYAPRLMAEGVTVMIGKGKRSAEVYKAMQTYKCVYLAAIGGAGALYKSCVRACRCVAFADLGCEAIYELQVENMQLLVAADARGNTFLQ